MWKIDVVVFIIGYVVSAYTWPLIRTKMYGIENEVLNIRQRLKDLEKKIRG